MPYSSSYVFGGGRGGRFFDPRTVGSPGWDRAIGAYDDERRRRRELAQLEDYWSNNYSGKMEDQKLVDTFMSMYGDGSYYSGDIGGVDRQYSGGVMNEYQGIGDANFNMGSMMGKGSHRVSKHGGLAPSVFYNMDPNYDKYMNKTVRYDQDANLWQMFMHPYDAERWGDYLPGSAEEREKLRDSAMFRGHGSMDLPTKILDKMRRGMRGF